MKKICVLLATLVAIPSWAQEVVNAAATTGHGLGDKAFYALGASLLLGLAALGGTLAQGKIGSAAMDGIARNPQAGKEMFTPMIVALALIESLVILSWLMANFFQGKF
ncbi:MAG: ATP synthase F0 subunit C [Bdellovibrionales bacterium]|nr:ATP synthase F0 subunit C [Bdellovibrionales bacterium]